MNEVSAIIDLPVLMLHCPKCKWRFPVKLPAFALATKEGKYISCAACGNEYSVRVELLDRVAEQRDDAETPIRGARPLCPHGVAYDELCEPCGRVPDPSPHS